MGCKGEEEDLLGVGVDVVEAGVAGGNLEAEVLEDGEGGVGGGLDVVEESSGNGGEELAEGLAWKE